MSKKSKPQINLILDGIMLILLALIAGVGFLIKYVLVPGFKRNELYGSGVELNLFGLDRHQWGDIHLYLSFAFLLLMLLHIVLHWKMICCIFKQMVGRQSSRRTISVCVGVVTLLLLAAPFLIKPDVSPVERKYSHRQEMLQRNEILLEGSLSQHSASVNTGKLSNEKQAVEKRRKNQSGVRHEHSNSELDIFGSMTLTDVSKKYAISESKLATAMGIPQGKSGERIGRLKREYGFDMSELKSKVAELRLNR
ncbi:protein of unknown function [Mariniphaga anaerophila]|uniref:Flavinylation-associated cytochrome domain-containing protein n=1 Tax=Mariniphaga anaerophila TaxID=1484053 RepID=A0A1M4WN46_9BACT|nr:DUF4405 domain-containing protein [Mariniphaga anaerophila]SHE82473.1 protein of unknown function [Mariniphaga anaerophila]